MNKFNTFLVDHGTKLILVLIVLTYFKSCGIDSELTKVKKELKNTQVEINQIDSTITKLPTSTDMRMIQATDRKMLDVQRQTQIEKEIEELQK
jgi:hypothetical protein